MNLFKTYTYSWQQIGVFKLALLSIGMIIGSYAHEFISANLPLVVIVALVATAYTMYVSWSQ